MDNPTRKQYREFLLSSWADTTLVEFRLAGHLRAVAVTDRLPDGLSAVYTFCDQTPPGKHGPVYKQEFRPQERFIDGRWHGVER